MNNSFENRVVLVTGASSGIGRACCVELTQRGAAVILLARNRERLEETAALLGECDRLIVECDLENLDGIASAVDMMWDWHGKIDALIYSAGQSTRLRLRDAGPAVMERLMRVNCFAFVELMRRLVKKKKKQELFQAAALSSLAALGHDKNLVPYAASKGALEAAAKTLAVELLPRNTRVNILRLAFAATPMGIMPTDGNSLWDDEKAIRDSGYQPLGIIPPNAAAKAAVALVGPESLYSTGCVFTMNAGALC